MNRSKQITDRIEMSLADEYNEFDILVTDEEIEDMELYTDEMLEGIDEVKFKKVIRGGQLVKKIVCKDGFVAKKNTDGKPICVKQTTQEKKQRSIAAKKAAKSRKGKGAAASRARAKSLAKRKSLLGGR